jgi:hypothetical protein
VGRECEVLPPAERRLLEDVVDLPVLRLQRLAPVGLEVAGVDEERVQPQLLLDGVHGEQGHQGVVVGPGRRLVGGGPLRHPPRQLKDPLVICRQVSDGSEAPAPAVIAHPRTPFF